MAPPLELITPKFSLTGKRYIITGGAQGIGFACAHAIAEMGGSIAILDIQDAPCAEYSLLSEKFGAKTVYIQTDVTKEDSLNQSFEKAIKFLGGVDGLIPCAGVAIDKPFVEQTWDEVTRIQEINVRGVFFSTQLATKAMISQGPPPAGQTYSILLIASQCSHVAIPGYRMAAYNASKGGILMLSKALAVELAPHGIRVNSISPGFIDSDQTRNIQKSKSKEEGDMMEKAAPMGRMGNVNDLMGVVVYLLSEASAYTTGADVPVTGGVHAGRVLVDKFD